MLGERMSLSPLDESTRAALADLIKSNERKIQWASNRWADFIGRDEAYSLSLFSLVCAAANKGIYEKAPKTWIKYSIGRGMTIVRRHESRYRVVEDEELEKSLGSTKLFSCEKECPFRLRLMTVIRMLPRSEYVALRRIGIHGFNYAELRVTGVNPITAKSYYNRAIEKLKRFFESEISNRYELNGIGGIGFFDEDGIFVPAAEICRRSKKPRRIVYTQILKGMPPEDLILTKSQLRAKREKAKASQ